jgi:hypothetical protein
MENQTMTNDIKNQPLPRRFKNKLVRALRSGRYTQTNGVMRDPQCNAYDVLGVAYRITGVPKGSITKMLGAPSGKQYNFLPKVLTYEDSKVTSTLMKLNDKGMSFRWIASHLENCM